MIRAHLLYGYFAVPKDFGEQLGRIKSAIAMNLGSGDRHYTWRDIDLTLEPSDVYRPPLQGKPYDMLIDVKVPRKLAAPSVSQTKTMLQHIKGILPSVKIALWLEIVEAHWAESTEVRKEKPVGRFIDLIGREYDERVIEGGFVHSACVVTTYLSHTDLETNMESWCGRNLRGYENAPKNKRRVNCPKCLERPPEAKNIRVA
jgi:hypothetical protein